MALTFGSGLTNISTCEATTGFSGFSIAGGGGSPTPALETDVFVQGDNSVGAKISGSGRIKGLMFDMGLGNEVDMSVTGRHFYIYIASTLPGIQDTWANGGIRVMASSSVAGTSNFAQWYVAGSDKAGISGGLIRYCVSLDKSRVSPTVETGTFDDTAVRWFGAAVSITGTAGNANNFLIDRLDYGQGASQVIGDGTLVAEFADMAAEDAVQINKYGLLVEEDGVFFALGGIKIGDSGQSATTEFDDATGAIVQFRNPVYHDGTDPDVSSIDAANLYRFTAEGAASFKTILKIGSVVGTGDDRQGLQGGSIGSAGPTWLLDLAADIADLTSVDLFGLNISKAGGGILLEDGNKTLVVSCAFVNCGELDPGIVNDGAEILSIAIIDPDGHGILIENPTHKLKKISMITSGVPSTQHLMRFPVHETFALDAFKLFGNFASGTLWHGDNEETRQVITAGSFIVGRSYEIETVGSTDFTLIGSPDNNIGTRFTATGVGSGTGTAAEVLQINAGDGSSIVEAEIENSGGTAGEVRITNTVTLTVEALDTLGVGIENAQVLIETDPGGVELLNGLTNGSGIATASFNFGGDQDIKYTIRKGTVDPKYRSVNAALGTITATGFSVTRILQRNTESELGG